MTIEKTKEREDSNPQKKRVGENLKLARLQHGLSIQDVSQALRLHARQIEAIEESNFSALPGQTYALGFLKTYAAYLGLNAQSMADAFKQEQGLILNNNLMSQNVETTRNKKADRGIYILLCLILLIGGGLFFIFMEQTNRTQVVYQEAIPPAPIVESMTGLSPEENVSQKNFPALDIKGHKQKENLFSAIAVKLSQMRVMLIAQQKTWIEITDATDIKILEKIMQPGEKLPVPHRQSLRLKTSNAGGLTLFLDGHSLGVLGQEGEIIQNISLAPNDLEKIMKNDKKRKHP